MEMYERVVSKATDSPLKGSAKLNTQSSLSATQRQRISYLEPVFGSSTMELVTLIEGRGRNSWTVVNRKVSILEHADYDLQRYHDALYDNYDLNKVYTANETIGIVGDVRRDLKMEPYITRLRTNCLNDFFGLFIVQDVIEEEIVDGVIRKKLVGYKPVFRLKPEDLD